MNKIRMIQPTRKIGKKKQVYHGVGSRFSYLDNFLIWGILVVTMGLVLTPLAFMVVSSVMPYREVMRIPFRWIPTSFHWQNYWQAIRGNDGSFIYLRNILNSFFVASMVTLTTVSISAMAGYGLAKLPFRGRNLVFIMIMATMMVPFEAIMIPLYLIVTKFGWQDSYIGLIIPLMVNAFGIFLMRQFLISFPDAVIDSARIEGASEFRIFWNIVLPNAIPAVVALGILTFRQQWDNLIWPLLITQSEEMKTIPLYIVRFNSEKYTNEGALMAVAVIASLPIIILFFSMGRYFSGGLTISGMKH